MHARVLGRLVIAMILLRLALAPAGPLYASTTSTSPPTNSPLLIGEVAWAGSSLSTADEWFELWNVSDEPWSLAGYSLRGASAESIVFNETHTVPARSAFLIANYSASDAKSVLAIEPDFVATAVALSNSGLKFELLASDGAVLDAAGNGSAPPAGDSPTKASMIRQADGSWATATTTSNFDEGITDLGTPSVCDLCADIASPTETVIEFFATSTDAIVSTSSTETIPSASLTENMIEGITTSTEITLEVASTTDAMPEETLTATTSSIETMFVNEEVAVVTSTEVATETSASSTEPGVELTQTTTSELITQQTADAQSSTPVDSQALAPVDTQSTTTAALDTLENATGTNELPVIPTEPTVIVAQTVSFAAQTQTNIELALEKIFPAPISGKEWIAVSGLAMDELERADGWSLRDGSGTIFRFSETSRTQVSADGELLVIQLTSSRLNNGSDLVELVRPDGSIAERMNYPATEKGKSWIKNAARTAWIIDPPPAPIVVETSAAAASTPILHPATVELPSEAPNAAVVTQQTAKPKAEAVSSATTKKIIKTAVKKTADKTKTVSTAKTASYIPTTINMISTEQSGRRVSVEGIVATKPGILSKYHFILVTEDGRGLYVRGTSRQTSPTMGSRVRLTGGLTANDDGVQLKMGTKDYWRLVQPEDSARPRTVNLLESAPEDNWSLTEIEGSVLEIKSSTVTLDIQGAIVELRIRPAVGYRAGRIMPGDKVKATGLLDLRGGEIGIYVRTPEDIEISEHAAPEEIKNAKPKTLPDWTPFGAAGLTVAVAESWKRLRRWQKRRKVEQLIVESKNLKT